MTDLRKAAEMALEALEKLTDNRIFTADLAGYYGAVISSLRQALAQPEQEKESTAQTVDPRLLLGRSNNFTKETENRLCDIERRLSVIETQPASPSKPWVSLTDQEMRHIRNQFAWNITPEYFSVFARAIEAALKERNT